MEDLLHRDEDFFNLTDDCRGSSSISKLFQILNSSSNLKDRCSAADILKEALQENAEYWYGSTQPNQTECKKIVLKNLMEEDTSLRNSVVALTIAIANYESNDLSAAWPEFFASIKKLLDGKSTSDNQVGILLFSALSAKRSETFLPHDELVLAFLAKIPSSLKEISNHTAIYDILRTTLHLAAAFKDDKNVRNAFNETMPHVICSTEAIAELDTDQIAKILHLLDGLSKNTSDGMFCHTVTLVKMCIRIAENKFIDPLLRIKALGIIKWLSYAKNKTIQNNELLIPIIDMIYTVMSEPVYEELGDFYLNAMTNNTTPLTCAMQILEVLSQHPSAEALTTQVLERMELTTGESSIYVKRGCYLAVAVITRECYELIDLKWLATFYKYIQQSFVDSTPIVRNAVQFTLGEIIHDLICIDKPALSEYADKLLPILDDYLKNAWMAIKENKEFPIVDTLFHMLKQFYYTFKEKTLPYLPIWMDYLFGILESNNSDHLKKLALLGFASAIRNLGQKMLPYSQKLITILQSWIDENETAVTANLQAEALTTLEEVVCRLNENDKFSLNQSVLESAVRFMKHSNDPILKSTAYTYVAESSCFTPTEAATMTKIETEAFDNLIKSIQLIPRTKFLQLKDINNKDSLMDQESKDKLDAQQPTKSQNNVIPSMTHIAYVMEQKSAIDAVGIISAYFGESFFPYVEKFYREIIEYIDCPEICISTTSLDTLISVFQLCSKIQSTKSDEIMKNMTQTLVPTLLNMVYECREYELLIAILSLYLGILEYVKSDFFMDEMYKNRTKDVIIDVLSGNTICQRLKETKTRNDSTVGYVANTMFINLQRLLQPNEILDLFAQVFSTQNPVVEEGNMQVRLDRIDSIMSTACSLGPAIINIAPQVVPLLIKEIADSSHTLTVSACTAIAKIARYGDGALNSYYPDITQTLLSTILQETEDFVTDNLISCLSSLIWTNYSILPIEVVFPVIMNHLPLKSHTEEYKAVFGAILALARDHHPILQSHMQRLAKIALNILQIDTRAKVKETKAFATDFLQVVQKEYSDVWNDLKTVLPPEDLTFVQQIVTTEPVNNLETGLSSK